MHPAIFLRRKDGKEEDDEGQREGRDLVKRAKAGGRERGWEIQEDTIFLVKSELYSVGSCSGFLVFLTFCPPLTHEEPVFINSKRTVRVSLGIACFKKADKII